MKLQHVVLVLIVSITALGAAGCGKSEGDKGKVTVKFQKVGS